MASSGILNTMASPLPPSVQNLSAQLRWAVPVVVVLAAIGLGRGFGLSIGLLTLAGGVLCGTIWLLWSSLQGLTGEAPLTLEEALSLGAPSAEEEQKRAVLRALKDLEYERAVGKINDADYASLAEHYRNEAKRPTTIWARSASARRRSWPSASPPTRRRARELMLPPMMLLRTLPRRRTSPPPATTARPLP
jgi:hypothetical protein